MKAIVAPLILVQVLIAVVTFAADVKENTYFPPPESQGGWRSLDDASEIRELGGMDPKKLGELEQWLLQSDQRNFAADERMWVMHSSPETGKR